MRRKIRTHKNSRVYRWILLLTLIAMLIVVIPPLAACEPCAELTIENRLDIDVTIVYGSIYSHGAYKESTVAVVPAGQTAETLCITLSPDISGVTIILKAVDEDGNIVWEKSWSFEEFRELEEVDWKVVVSPETGC